MQDVFDLFLQERELAQAELDGKNFCHGLTFSPK